MVKAAPAVAVVYCSALAGWATTAGRLSGLLQAQVEAGKANKRKRREEEQKLGFVPPLQQP